MKGDFVRMCTYDSVEGIVQNIIKCRPVNVLYHCGRDLLSWCDANGLAISFFHRVVRAAISSGISLLRLF